MKQHRWQIMLCAGEASSDMHAAHVLDSLHSQGIEFDSFGMGADKLANAGMELTLDCRDLAVIGIVDVLINYRKFQKRLAILRQELKKRQPDLLIIVDYPDFNLKLAETARKLGIPVLFYISPQVWAWRKKRIKRIGTLVSHMAVLFPFEVDVYEQAGIPVSYVGHPLVDTAHSKLTRTDTCVQFGLNENKPVIALLPGSRIGELQRNLPVMLQTADRLASQKPAVQFIVPVAPTLDHTVVEAVIDDHRNATNAGQKNALPATNASADKNVTVIDGQAYDAMHAADAVLSASGTATLETAMLGTPMAVMYVINPINYAIMSRLIQIDDIALVNIVAGKRIVQEFIQQDAQPDAMAAELIKILDDEQYRTSILEGLKQVQLRMGDGGASDNVAKLVVDMLTRSEISKD